VRRTLSSVNLDADRIAEVTARPVAGLTRRDVALMLLAVPAADALSALPGIRRGMLAAGNPLSATFWSSAEKTLHLIEDGDATVGDVQIWLQATGTEPNGIIGLHVWDEAPERSDLAEEMHVRLVGYLEERLAVGEIDPDALASGDPSALSAYTRIQEGWMTSPLSDGRVPMDVLLEEQDEEFLAEWDAADAEALSMLEALIEQVGERTRPEEALHQACTRLREVIAAPGWQSELLIECGGLDPEDIPADDTDLWLTLAAGVASPMGTDDWEPGEVDEDDELSETDSAIASICAIDHFDWLAVTSMLTVGGPGTSASAADLAMYVRDFDPDGADEEDEVEEPEDLEAEVKIEAGKDLEDTDLEEIEDTLEEIEDTLEELEELEELDEFELEEFDELGMESLFLPVTTLWQVLGAIDADDRLTPLGWWGLPEAMRQVWAPAE
jgi:hypothetical protein